MIIYFKKTIKAVYNFLSIQKEKKQKTTYLFVIGCVKLMCEVKFSVCEVYFKFFHFLNTFKKYCMQQGVKYT